jgi:hypothetical protein
VSSAIQLGHKDVGAHVVKPQHYLRQPYDFP